MFSTQPSDAYETPKVWAIGTDGVKVRLGGTPPVPTAQHSVSRNRIVYSIAKTEHDHDYFACGIAGCTSGRRTETASLAIAEEDGSNERLLIKEGFNREPAFSPDASMIAFIAHLEGDIDRVTLISPDGKRIDVLDRPNHGNDTSFAWAPNGKTLAIARHDSSPDNERVDIVRTSGQLVRTVARSWFTDIVWSPNGRYLLGTKMGRDPRSDENGHHTGSDLWKIPLDGSGERRLTYFAPSLPRYDDVTRCGNRLSRGNQLKEVSFSPDGKHIAFITSYGDANTHSDYDLAIVRADGTGFRILRPAHIGRCYERNGRERLNDGWVHDDMHVLGWQWLPALRGR